MMNGNSVAAEVGSIMMNWPGSNVLLQEEPPVAANKPAKKPATKQPPSLPTPASMGGFETYLKDPNTGVFYKAGM